jgi:hypothetical protein
VHWATRDAGSPRVRWGERPGQLTSQAAGRTARYARGDMCGAPANASGWLDPGSLHAAVMAGLQPGRQYYYQYGDEASRGTAAQGALLPAQHSRAGMH